MWWKKICSELRNVQYDLALYHSLDVKLSNYFHFCSLILWILVPISVSIVKKIICHYGSTYAIVRACLIIWNKKAAEWMLVAEKNMLRKVDTANLHFFRFLIYFVFLWSPILWILLLVLVSIVKKVTHLLLGHA